MTLHQFDENKKPDSEYFDGELAFLVPGNVCRLMDGRRTPGVIDEVFLESGMFRWRITNFEDKGRYWDMPLEHYDSFQFEKDSKRLTEKEIGEMQDKIEFFDKPLEIIADESVKAETEKEILALQKNIEEWLKENSEFIKEKHTLDMDSNRGSEVLASDLMKYLESIGYAEQEKLTGDILVLNPNSGEWFKGMKIVMSELGLTSYKGKITRTPDVFTGLGEKGKRREYLMHRLAFLRAFFSLQDISRVTLYRGMSTEIDWRKIDRTFLSFTFNHDVGQSFADFKKDSYAINSYLIKASVPVEELFMTYLETDAMNKQYMEAEAMIFNTGSIGLNM